MLPISMLQIESWRSRNPLDDLELRRFFEILQKEVPLCITSPNRKKSKQLFHFVGCSMTVSEIAKRRMGGGFILLSPQLVLQVDAQGPSEYELISDRNYI
jgi:hypothetical protein